jgi:hypothetical protein
MRAGASFLAVAARPMPIATALKTTGAAISIHPFDRYAIVEAKF